MPLSPQAVYEQNIDRQRIVITGTCSTILTKLLTAVLSYNHRAFCLMTNGELHMADSPVLIINENRADSLDGYHHHIAIFTGKEATSAADHERFADATPKGGIILYPESDNLLKSIGSRERADVQAIPYKTIPHEVVRGAVSLVTSTNERFPIHFQADQSLELLAAAKEVLKKIGISSGQFYRAAASIQTI